MKIGGAFIIVAILIIAIWLLIELKRMRHKVFAIFLIILIIFSYISFSVVLKGEDIDYTTPSGVFHAGRLYLAWLGSAFGNVKTITGDAIKMDWTSVNTPKNITK